MWWWCESIQCEMWIANRAVLSLQLQSNLIPGLNLNALGLFPTTATGMGPSMSNITPPGAHSGCSSFGVSETLLQICAYCIHYITQIQGSPCLIVTLGVLVPWVRLVKSVRVETLSLATRYHVCFFPFSAVLMGVKGHFGLLCCQRVASPLL